MNLKVFETLVTKIIWLAKLKPQEVAHVRRDSQTLLIELGRSLRSLNDVVATVRSVPTDLRGDTLQDAIKYVQDFYLGRHSNGIESTRTRCREIRRQTRRILFKLE